MTLQVVEGPKYATLGFLVIVIVEYTPQNLFYLFKPQIHYGFSIHGLRLCVALQTQYNLTTVSFGF